MKIIIAYNTKIEIQIDDEDFELLNQFQWYDGGDSLMRFDYRGKKVNITIGQTINGTRLMYDHKDRNYLNNVRSNLRVASFSQNAINRGKLKGCSSKYKGVCWNKALNKWLASIRIKGFKVNLGHHLSEDDAARAYDKAAYERDKEFHVLNFPEDICK